MPDASPPPPIGISTVSTSGTCSASSSPIVPWPAITTGSSNGWTNVAPCSATYSIAASRHSSSRAAPSARPRRRSGASHRPSPSARPAARRCARARRPRAPPTRPPGRGCRRSPRRRPRRAPRRQRRDPVVRAADLERAGALEVLRLQPHLAADEPRERLRPVDGRDARDAVEARARRLDVSERRCCLSSRQCGTPSPGSLGLRSAGRARAAAPRRAAAAARDRPRPRARDAASPAPTRPRTPRRRGSARRRSSSCPDCLEVRAVLLDLLPELGDVLAARRLGEDDRRPPVAVAGRARGSSAPRSASSSRPGDPSC